MLSGPSPARAATDPDAAHAAAKPVAKTAAHAKAHVKTKTAEAKPLVAKPAQPAAALPVPAKPNDAAPTAAGVSESKPDNGKPTETRAPPHFASLRAEKVNLRSGPSEDFPIQWVFSRRGLPVEILAAFDIWRKVRTFDGTEGWVHQQMLTGRRSALITGTIRNLHRDPDPASSIVAQLEPGVVAAMSHCNPDWCELKAGGYKGWLKRDELWGLEPDEVIQ
jgi:SH3-like domain-containing protein